MLSPYPTRGAAFIYVMVIFIAASVIAASLLSREHMGIVQTARFMDEMQARQYAYGAETYARQLLYDATGNDTGSGNYPMLSIEGGNIDLTIEDLRGRFNVNSLLFGNQEAENYFTNLCLQHGIDESTVELLLSHVRQINAPAEGAAPATSPRWLADASELVDYQLPADAWRTLAPFLTATPDKSYSINVNAAPDALLQAYLNDDEQVATIRAAVKKQGNISKDALAQLQITNNALETKSDIFMSHVTVQLNNQVTHLHSTLLRQQSGSTKRVTTIARHWGN